MKKFNSTLNQFIGLKSHTKLKQKTPLKAHKPLNKVSDKQELKNKEWAKIKKQRIELLIEKYGFLPDEYTGEDISNEAIIDGHHNDRNRNHNYLSNCRILKRFTHTVVTDENIKDVKDWLNKEI